MNTEQQKFAEENRRLVWYVLHKLAVGQSARKAFGQEDAEGIATLAYCKVIESCDLQSPTAVSYIVQGIMNALVSALRAHRPELPLSSGYDVVDKDPHSADVSGLIEQLPEKHQQMCYMLIEGCDMKYIATALGLSRRKARRMRDEIKEVLS